MNRSLSPSVSLFRAACLGILVAGLSLSCNKSFDTNAVAFEVTIRASLNSAGLEGHGDAIGGGGAGYGMIDRPAISSDGRYVAFATKAEDLVSNDNNHLVDIYWKDL